MNVLITDIFHTMFVYFSWVTRLLVTPSKLLLQTAGVLIGTCLLIAGLILILHIKEKVCHPFYKLQFKDLVDL